VKFTGVLAEIGNNTRGTFSLDVAARAVKSINKKQVRIILILCSSFGPTIVLNFQKLDLVYSMPLFSVLLQDSGAYCNASDSADAMDSKNDLSASQLSPTVFNLKIETLS